jgi:hypothetical protein
MLALVAGVLRSRAQELSASSEIDEQSYVFSGIYPVDGFTPIL